MFVFQRINTSLSSFPVIQNLNQESSPAKQIFRFQWFWCNDVGEAVSGFGIQIFLEQAFPLITLHHLFLWLWLYPLVPVPHTTGSIGEPLYKLSYYFTVLVIGLVCILTPHSFLTGTVRALYLLIAEFYLNYRAFLSYLCTIGTLDGTTRAFHIGYRNTIPIFLTLSGSFAKSFILIVTVFLLPWLGLTQLGRQSSNLTSLWNTFWYLGCSCQLSTIRLHL